MEHSAIIIQTKRNSNQQIKKGKWTAKDNDTFLRTNKKTLMKKIHVGFQYIQREICHRTEIKSGECIIKYLIHVR
jgi:hypothetical protein